MTGKVILVTKNKTEAEKHFKSLSTSGFEILYFPTIQIIPMYDSVDLISNLSSLQKYDWMIFTSANAAEVTFLAARKNNITLSKINIACVGSETAERCRKYGVNVGVIPNEFSAASLVKEFAKQNLVGKKIFIPCSSLSRSELKIELSELGAEVTSVPSYDVVANEEKNLINELEKISIKKPDVFVFTSPSSFNSFLEIMKIDNPQDYFRRMVVCAIGRTTESAVAAFNVHVNIVPEQYSISGVVAGILKYYSIEKNIA